MALLQHAPCGSRWRWGQRGWGRGDGRQHVSSPPQYQRARAAPPAPTWNDVGCVLHAPKAFLVLVAHRLGHRPLRVHHPRAAARWCSCACPAIPHTQKHRESDIERIRPLVRRRPPRSYYSTRPSFLVRGAAQTAHSLAPMHRVAPRVDSTDLHEDSSDHLRSNAHLCTVPVPLLFPLSRMRQLSPPPCSNCQLRPSAPMRAAIEAPHPSFFTRKSRVSFVT